MGAHEDYRRKDDTRMGSDRSLGLVFAGVFAVIAAIRWNLGHEDWVWGLAVAAGAFLVAALAAPRLLRPLNIVWFRLGLLLHHLVSPLIMALLFYLTVTPTAVILRLLSKDPLRRRLDSEAASYWIPREPPGPAPETMTRQF